MSTPAQLVFSYSNKNDDQYVVITARSINVLKELALNPTIQSMANDPNITAQGLEALISEMLLQQPGGIKQINRYKNNHDNKKNKHHDGPNGEPAIETFNANGRVIKAERYIDGDRQDGINGEPAILKFDDQGNVISFTHYNAGTITPPPTPEQKKEINKSKLNFVQQQLGKRFTVRLNP